MPLTPRQEFKVSFLQKCAEAGLTYEETVGVAEDLLATMQKQAFGFKDIIGIPKTIIDTTRSGIGLTGDLAKIVGTAGLAGLGVTGGAGALGGYTAARMTDTNDEDVDDLKQREKIETYRRLAQQLRERNQRTQEQAPLRRRRTVRTLV